MATAPAPRPTPAAGVDPIETEPPSPAALPSRTAGLALRLEPKGLAAGASSDQRIARLCAFAVPAGTRFSPSFPPGPFCAEFRGTIEVDVRERYVFTFDGTGALEFEVNDQQVLNGAVSAMAPLRSEPVRLAKGRNSIVVRYTSPDTGEARLRVLWSTSEFKPEPIPPEALSHEASAPASPDVRAARAAVQRLQCTACHAGADSISVPSAPDLRSVGERLHPGWVAAWLEHPVRSGWAPRQMPHFFAADPEGKQQAADVAAYLTTLGGSDAPATEVSAADAQAVREGGVLFANLGCVGCHRRPGGVEDSRTGLDHLAQKWKPAALIAYLQSPHALDPGASMPDFHFTADEATALAAFLLGGGAPAAPPLVGDVGRGRELVTAKRCAACHALPGPTAPAAAPWGDVATRVGTGPDPCSGPPFYLTSAGDIDWGSAAFGGGLPWVDVAQERVTALRCHACHTRDGVVDQWTQHAGEVADLVAGAVPDPAHPEVAQTRPSLTWAGEKLRTDALRAVLAGELRPARPWLHARMPSFPAHAEALALGLACEHGVSAVLAAPPAPAPSPEQVAIGAALVSAKNFACVTCHGVGDQPPTQVFEVQGIDFALAHARLRPEFFMRWMRNPQRIEPGSKMPSYADTRGKTPFTQVLDGDADRQFAAIWAWMTSLR